MAAVTSNDQVKVLVRGTEAKSLLPPFLSDISKLSALIKYKRTAGNLQQTDELTMAMIAKKNGYAYYIGNRSLSASSDGITLDRIRLTSEIKQI